MKRGLKKLLRVVRNLVLITIGLSVGVVLVMRWLNPPTSSFMLQARAGGIEVHSEWVPLERISPSMQLAVIAAEDQRFPRHYGLDFEAISNAIEEHVEENERLRGASTITQQTAKNLFLWPGRSFVRKGLEAWFALLIDLMWSKQRILEVYLNVAQFGRGIYGAQAAAEIYYGKDAANLTANESAALAAVLPDPLDYSVLEPSNYVRRRQAWIRQQMAQLGLAYLKRLE